MITGPLKWYTVAEALRVAIDAELTVAPARSSVVPGAIAWDECDCGLLAVSVAQIFLSDTFPDQLANKAGTRCDAAWEVGEFVLQIIRCAPQPEDGKLAPTTPALDASAQEVLRDAYELLLGASVKLCQMSDAQDIVDFIMRPLTAQGPSGACVGSELRVFVALQRN
jgi:hypothetical protein